MSPSNDSTISNIASMLDNNKWGYVLLIGSGLSTSAGIPTAYSISMDLIKKKYASMNSSKFSNLNDYEKWYYTETGKTNIDYSDIIDWYFNKNSDKRLRHCILGIGYMKYSISTITSRKVDFVVHIR